MTSDLPLDDRLSQAIEMLQAGERSTAASWFGKLWPEVVEGGDPMVACRLAHFAADAQDDVTAELRWDLIALDQARRAAEKSRPGHEEISAFFPSLHLNVADCYLRLGDVEHCRDHFHHAEAMVHALPITGYGTMIRAAIVRLGDRLHAHSAYGGEPPEREAPRG